VFIAVRLLIALSPPLRETYYDEALTGLMSLAILRGIPQVFYWGQPYLGALDAYLAAGAFYIFGPSTLALRLGVIWISLLWVWAAWRIGRELAGERWGLLAGLQVALPPIFLSFNQLSSHAEGVALGLGTVTLAIAVRLLDPRPTRGERWLWAALGLTAGLAWWTTPMVTMMLGAAALGLLVARPAILAGPRPYMALALFGLGSLPFWIWNARHDWVSFEHLLTWGATLPPFSLRVRNVADSLARALRDTYWDSRVAPLSPAASALGWIVVVAVYVPAVLLAASRLVVWIRRGARRERPLQEPLDLVALAFWLTAAAQLLTWFGTSGVIRYSLTFFGPLPLLVTAVLGRVARRGRAGEIAAFALAGALLVFNLLTQVAFVRAGTSEPVRPVDAVIARMTALGATACYADSRISQVISFESTGRIVCADYVGLRDYASLRTVDAVETPATVALVAHQRLKGPAPEVLARELTRIGGTVERSAVGDYVVFHHFVPPDPRIRPVSAAGWRARASLDAEHAALAFDRRAWTGWAVPKRVGEWIEIDLGQARPLTQVSLLAGPPTTDSPEGLRVEVSEDGLRWETVAVDDDVLAGLHWWKGHPRVDDSGRVIVRFAPRTARYLRLTEIGMPVQNGLWNVAELFVYEAADSPARPSAAGSAALGDAMRALDHWMDDPTGPHPLRAPATTEHRRAQVPWGAAFAAVNAALTADPEWEDAHHVYAWALAKSGWGEGLDWLLDQTRRAGAWQEVARLSELLTENPDAAWRAHRQEAWAEALDHLGRPAEAAVLRARPEPEPGRPLRVLFGRELELVGIDGPTEARPGETVRLGYHWRLVAPTAYDYCVFLHVVGLPGGGNYDKVVGGYGSSNWSPGERVAQTVSFTVPPGTAPGRYPLRVGVWLPTTGRRLFPVTTDVPQAHRSVTIGTLVVTP
jgi:hypothetical protein